MSRTRTTRLKIDTRSRQPGTSISNPTFNLNNEIVKNSRARVLSVSFSNTLNNVDSNHNTLAFATATPAIFPPGFYTPQQLADFLGGTYDPLTNLITLDIGADSIDQTQTTMGNIFTLDPTKAYTGVIELGPIFLANPMMIEFVSGQLQCYNNSYSNRSRLQTSPFFEVPVEVGYGQMQTVRPNQLITLDQNGTHLGSVNIQVQDSLDGRELKEIGHWSMVIELSS